MTISVGDEDWESRLSAAFKSRLQFELRDVDKLKLADAHLYKLISGWSLRHNYTPKMTSSTSIRFRPDELPPDPSIWNMPHPDPKQRSEA